MVVTEAGQQPAAGGRRERGRWLRRVARLWLAAVMAAAAAAGIAAALPLQVPIPDTHSGMGASAVGDVNDWTSVQQEFHTDLDGLFRIDVALSTLQRTDGADLQFYVHQEDRDGPRLRTLRPSLETLPEGRALDLYSSRWQDLPWVSFDFEPLRGYAGRKLSFSVEGKEVARTNTVQVLLSYPKNYQRGDASKDGNHLGASTVFRTYTTGTTPDLLDVTFSLLARGRPGFLGLEGLYQGVAVASAGLVALLFAAIAALNAQEDHQ